MPLPLSSRIALVTGASRGIGYATARALAKAGAHVVAVARTQAGLEELDDEIRKDGGAATLVPLDLTDFDGIARLAAARCSSLRAPRTRRLPMSAPTPPPKPRSRRWCGCGPTRRHRRGFASICS